AGVAHELNTPIGNATMASSTLKDFAERIQQQLATGSVTKSGLKEFLNDAIMAAGITSRNLEKASELITSFKQVATDQSSSQRRTFSLNELFHEILLTLHPQTKKKAIKIELDVASEISLDSYPGPLGQVLSNLIMNAFIHGFEDRMQGRIRISAMKEEDKVQITLEDDGKGIPETALPKIFDPFYTTRLGQGGSGLGLHICHNIVVDTLAGKIRAESEVGQGTRFLLTLAACAPRLEEV
ncbi:sensor histidine kinase, partial [Oleiphilus sp. HI0079]|uniref:sensor histidine kinase n=3 Tax=unclassified Oleiphilus TaxID=2631174 RepID=UPI000A619687